MKVLAAPGRFRGSARAFLRGSRGSAGIAVVIGVGVLLSTAAACFDLYTRVAAGSAAGRIAVTMADYVSRETAPDGDQIEALGRYLLDRQLVAPLGAPADLVVVVSAIRRAPAATGPEVLWAETIEVPFDPGDRVVTAELAADCGRFGAGGGAAMFPAGFDMEAGEVIVVAELCARLRELGALTSAVATGDIYRVFAFPTRASGAVPAEPVRAPGAGVGA